MVLYGGIDYDEPGGGFSTPPTNGGGLGGLIGGIGNLVGGIGSYFGTPPVYGGGTGGAPYYAPPPGSQQPYTPPPGTPVVPVTDAGGGGQGNGGAGKQITLPSMGGMTGGGINLPPITPLQMSFAQPYNLLASLPGPARGGKIAIQPASTNPGPMGLPRGAVPQMQTMSDATNARAPQQMPGGPGGSEQQLQRQTALFDDGSPARQTQQPAQQRVPVGGPGGPVGMPMPMSAPQRPAPPAPVNPALIPPAPIKRKRRGANLFDDPPGIRTTVGAGGLAVTDPDRGLPSRSLTSSKLPQGGTALIDSKTGRPIRGKLPAKPGALPKELQEQFDEYMASRPGEMEAQAPSMDEPPVAPTSSKTETPQSADPYEIPDTPKLPAQPAEFKGRTMPPEYGANSPMYTRDMTQEDPAVLRARVTRMQQINQLADQLNNMPQPNEKLQHYHAQALNYYNNAMQNRQSPSVPIPVLSKLINYGLRPGATKNALPRSPRALAAMATDVYGKGAEFKAYEKNFYDTEDQYNALMKEHRDDMIQRDKDIRSAQSAQADDQYRHDEKIRDDAMDMLKSMPPGPQKDAYLQKMGDLGVLTPRETQLVNLLYDQNKAEEHALNMAQKRQQLDMGADRKKALQTRTAATEQRMANAKAMEGINKQLKELTVAEKRIKNGPLAEKQQLQLANARATLQQKLINIQMADSRAASMELKALLTLGQIEGTNADQFRDIAGAAGKGLTGDAKTEAVANKRAELADRAKKAADLAGKVKATPAQLQATHARVSELLGQGMSRSEVQKKLGDRANLDTLEALYGRF